MHAAINYEPRERSHKLHKTDEARESIGAKREREEADVRK